MTPMLTNLLFANVILAILINQTLECDSGQKQVEGHCARVIKSGDVQSYSLSTNLDPAYAVYIPEQVEVTYAFVVTLKSDNNSGSFLMELDLLGGDCSDCSWSKQFNLNEKWSQGYTNEVDPHYFTFNKQSEKLLFTLTGSSSEIQIQMTVDVYLFVNNKLLLILGIVALSVSAVVVIGIVIFCCYRRWKRRRQEEQKTSYKHHMLDNIKKQLPAVPAKDLLLPKMSTCSICLAEYSSEDLVRKLTCSHIFHVDCIDSWCMKNMNCPICREDLDEQSIKKRKLAGPLNINWQDNQLSVRQGLLEMVPTDHKNVQKIQDHHI